MVVSVPLVEVSAKVRMGFAVNDDEDYAVGAWTGVIPMKWRRKPRFATRVATLQLLRRQTSSSIRGRNSPRLHHLSHAPSDIEY